MASSTLDNSLCLQCADDSTIHRHWKVSNIKHCCQKMRTDINGLANSLFTQTLYLVYKNRKNNGIYNQTIRYHKLNEIFSSVLITCNNENVSQFKSWKLLGA